jgi:hypothetical protein
MTWGALFDRAESYETTVSAIRETLRKRRETGDEAGEN